MRLLYFTPQQIWPVNSGSRLRNYNLARQLAARACVTLVEMGRAGQVQHISKENSDLANAVSLDKGRAYSPSIILRGLAGPTPMTVLNCWSPRSASQLADVLRSNQFDTVQIEGVHLMKFLPMIQKTPACPAIVVDWHNIESELMWRYAITTSNWAKRFAARRTAKLIERVEDYLLDTCAMHTVPSERERQKLLARRPDSNIKVISNGVDTGYYIPGKIADGCCKSSPGILKQTIVFVGHMDYHANIDAVIWFSRVAWPEIARTHPALHFMIVGRDPSAEVRALASDRIHVTGTVADVRPFYASAVAAVVPLRVGSGTRLKILEAMAAGVPVVSTKLGAEGIDVEHDIHFLQADSGSDIAAAVHRIASSDETRSRLSQAAQELVCRAYDWSVIGKQLFRLHEELAETRLSGSLRKVS